MPEFEDEDSRTIFCANLSDKVTEALLYELFLQGGPLEKVAQPKDKDGRARTFAFITYVHAVSVPYAVDLFQGTQLFNRELTIKPRNSNNPNVPQRVENSMPEQLHPFTMRNPFETNVRFDSDGNSRSRDHQQAHRTPYEQSSLRSSFNPIPTKASMQMQPQQPNRFQNQQQALQQQQQQQVANDLSKLISLGANMLQSSSRHSDLPTRPTYDQLFTDRDGSDRHSSNLKMSSRHNSRSHYRDEPYSTRRDGRDPPRLQHRNSGDRRKR